MTLDDHLAKVGTFRRSGQNPTAETDFVAALRDDAALRKAATAELARCTPDVQMRCFGSRLTATILTDMIKQV